MSWIKHPNLVEWTILKSDTAAIVKFFSKDKIRVYNMTEGDALKSVKIISVSFDSIKSAIKLKQELKVKDYKFQFIGGLNEKNEIIVFVNGFSVKLPHWLQSNWKTEIVEYKCLRDELIFLKLNLAKGEYYQVAKDECE